MDCWNVSMAPDADICLEKLELLEGRDHLRKMGFIALTFPPPVCSPLIQQSIIYVQPD